jgi:hypothetical protein
MIYTQVYLFFTFSSNNYTFTFDGLLNNTGGNNIVMQLELNLDLVELNSNTLNGI